MFTFYVNSQSIYMYKYAYIYIYMYKNIDVYIMHVYIYIYIYNSCLWVFTCFIIRENNNEMCVSFYGWQFPIYALCGRSLVSLLRPKDEWRPLTWLPWVTSSCYQLHDSQCRADFRTKNKLHLYILYTIIHYIYKYTRMQTPSSHDSVN